MRFLLTNDDGIDSPGLRMLAEKLSAAHEVWIVAPESERSACGMSISIRRPVRVAQRGPREFATDGTPVDCVMTGLLRVIPDEIDAVISGINRGPNLGTDILYSGTVAAARQGALLGKPSFALSLFDERQEFDYTQAALFAAREIPRFVAHWSEDHFLNINFPATAVPPYTSAVTIPGRRVYGDSYRTFSAPDGGLYCFLEGDLVACRDEAGSDFNAVSDGLVSISALAVHPAASPASPVYRPIVDAGERTRP
jgi:5'-nucleotidase